MRTSKPLIIENPNGTLLVDDYDDELDICNNPISHNPPSPKSFNLAIKDSTKFTHQILIDTIADLSIEPEVFNLESTVSLEKKVFSGLEKLGQYAELQSTFVCNVSQSLITKLIKLLHTYSAEKDKLAIDLETAKQQHGLSEEEKLLECIKNTELQSTITNLQKQILTLNDQDITHNEYVASLTQQINELENANKHERQLRQKAEDINNTLLDKLASEQELNKTISEEKELACQQARKAIARARQVMNHFFSSTLQETLPLESQSMQHNLESQE